MTPHEETLSEHPQLHRLWIQHQHKEARARLVEARLELRSTTLGHAHRLQVRS